MRGHVVAITALRLEPLRGTPSCANASSICGTMPPAMNTPPRAPTVSARFPRDGAEHREEHPLRLARERLALLRERRLRRSASRSGWPRPASSCERDVEIHEPGPDSTCSAEQWPVVAVANDRDDLGLLVRERRPSSRGRLRRSRRPSRRSRASATATPRPEPGPIAASVARAAALPPPTVCRSARAEVRQAPMRSRRNRCTTSSRLKPSASLSAACEKRQSMLIICTSSPRIGAATAIAARFGRSVARR